MQILDAQTQIEKFLRNGCDFPPSFFEKKSSTFHQIEKFLQTGATIPREERTASCHEAGHTDREGGELTFAMIIFIAPFKNDQVLGD